jgi:hypothetical protein
MKRAALLPLFLIALNAGAWTRAADLRIAKKAAALAPTDLRTILERFPHDYESAVAQAAADEGSPTHFEQRLRARIDAETSAAIKSIRGNGPMSDVVAHLGALAHFVADANNPFHVTAANASAPTHEDFERYFERRLTKYPTVFYGLDPNFRLNAYLDRTFARTAHYWPLIGEEYARAESSADFDDRSTAFGVASVCYSHAVTDLVNLYYFIWKEAGGDVRFASVLRRGNLQLHEH